MSLHPKTLNPAGPLACAALAVGIIWAPTSASASAESLPDLVERISPAVVTVLARSGGQRDPFDFDGASPFGDFFHQFGHRERGGDRRSTPRQGLGSGFVLDPGGYVVTNHHVIEGADAVTIRMPGVGDLAAEIIGADPATDLALLRVESESALPFVTLGDSDAVRVGEDVVAVGHPFGLGGTVTRGIVSATQRDIQAGPYVDFIQTDAAINRGNSGGPLFNRQGEVIGVNSAIYSPNGGSVGVGFAVASNIVAEVVEDLRTSGSVARGWLGVQIQTVAPEIAQALGLETARGALVSGVVEDGPSDGVLERGDVILSFDGRSVSSSRQLPKLVGAAPSGEPVSLRLVREGREIDREVTLGELGQDQRAALEPRRTGRASSDRLGATLEPLDEATRFRLSLEDDLSGVVVTSLQRGGPAERAGLRIGDVILRVGQSDVGSPRELDRALAEADDNALMLIHRRGSEIFVGLRLG
ncbi:MAG: Do family serine endopeptidase [Pseudomonadota bacterium]